ncbi:MAG: hypothetical protein ACN4GR_06070 [Arenicellales bacterium]
MDTVSLRGAIDINPGKQIGSRISPVSKNILDVAYYRGWKSAVGGHGKGICDEGSYPKHVSVTAKLCKVSETFWREK